MSLPRSPHLMCRARSALIVIDIQTKLIGLIPDREQMLFNATRLVEGAGLFGIPCVGTEQYPQGLGGTVDGLSELLPTWHAKTRFSCGECGEVFRDLREAGREQLMLVGMETHVCVQQTALDLLSEGFDVFVAVDAVAARHRLDHEVALRRMEGSGVTLTTTEAALFEWCEASSAAEFKALSQLIRRTFTPTT